MRRATRGTKKDEVTAVAVAMNGYGTFIMDDENVEEREWICKNYFSPDPRLEDLESEEKVSHHPIVADRLHSVAVGSKL